VIASRSRRRSAWVVAACVAALGLTAVAGCGAGIQTQTSSQVAPVPGVSWDSPDGSVALRNVQIAPTAVTGYPEGSSAPLFVRIFNNGRLPIKLTGVRSDTGTVQLFGGPNPTKAEPSPTAASPTATASPGATGSPSPSPAASPTPTGPVGSTDITIAIPVAGFVELVPGEGEYLQITGLTRAVKPGDDQAVLVQFTFDNGQNAILQLRIAPPLTANPRPSPSL
jgi:hypothetical protein